MADEDIPQHVPCELVRNALPPALAARLLRVPHLPPCAEPQGCRTRFCRGTGYPAQASGC